MILDRILATPKPLESQRAAQAGPRNRRTAVWVRAAVLMSAVVLMLPGVWGHSATVVEFAQLPAGLAAWQRHSLGIYRVCGPLSKFLYALPAYTAGVRVAYPAEYDDDIMSRREWNVGRRFQAQHIKRYHALYRWSRLLPMLVTIAGGCLICEFSTRLFGTWHGIVSLCLWCWMPPILAHGSLVTSDVLSAVMLVVAARTFWAFLLAPSAKTVLPAGVTLGMAAATKFTLLILYPCWLILVVSRAIQLRGAGTEAPRAGRHSPIGFLVACFLLLLLSIFVIDALYLFQNVGFRLSQWHSERSIAAREIHCLGSSRATAWLLDVPLPIPMEFVRGLDFQLADTERTQSGYLLGHMRVGGWWYWYYVAALIKIPLPALALFTVALVRRPRAISDSAARQWGVLCLLLPAVETATAIVATTGTGTNAAFRYLLPTIALICVWTGHLGGIRSRLARSVTMGLLGWLLVNAVTALPDHIAWRNELGLLLSRHRPALIGDSLDWGQDLARLSAWIRQHSDKGSTLVHVYGLGGGEPYDLGSPAAAAVSASRRGATYLAVSDNVLFGYERNICVTAVGSDFPVTSDHLETLQHQQPVGQVGRTIRIFQIPAPSSEVPNARRVGR